MIDPQHQRECGKVLRSVACSAVPFEPPFAALLERIEFEASDLAKA